MGDREEFLAALTEDSAFNFNRLMKKHVSINRIVHYMFLLSFFSLLKRSLGPYLDWMNYKIKNADGLHIL